MIKAIYPYFLLCVRITIGFIFLYASWDKIRHPSEFAEIVSNYKLLPYVLINLFSLILPWIEFICGIGLIIGLRIRSCSILLSILVLIFIIALSINWARGIDINCGCFSTEPQIKYSIPSLIGRDILILLFIIMLIKENNFIFAIDNLFK